MLEECIHRTHTATVQKIRILPKLDISFACNKVTKDFLQRPASLDTLEVIRHTEVIILLYRPLPFSRGSAQKIQHMYKIQKLMVTLKELGCVKMI